MFRCTAQCLPGIRLADAGRAFPVGPGPGRYRVQFLCSERVDAPQVRGALAVRGQALALDRHRNLAGQRGQPAQQLGQNVKPALLALGQRRVGAKAQR